MAAAAQTPRCAVASDFTLFDRVGLPKSPAQVVSVVPLSSSTPTQSPAHSFVPRTVPTSLQPDGSFGFTQTTGLLPTIGGAL